MNGKVKTYDMSNKMDWKIWAKKIGKQAVIIFIAGLASIYGGSSWFLAIAPVLTAIENYWKHK